MARRLEIKDSFGDTMFFEQWGTNPNISVVVKEGSQLATVVLTPEAARDLAAFITAPPEIADSPHTPAKAAQAIRTERARLTDLSGCATSDK